MEDNKMTIKTIDARGLACPLPVVNAKNAALEMKDGGQLTVLVDNEIAVQNLQKFAVQRGYTASARKQAEMEYAVDFQIPGGEGVPVADVSVQCSPVSGKSGMVVVLSGNTMGTGDEKLGKALMKAFVFALTRQDVLPETILCYNGGAFLSCEGADTLDDLKSLQAEGVNILTCGTCLDFYGIKDKLAVGSVTNMYEIVETMQRAASIVKP